MQAQSHRLWRVPEHAHLAWRCWDDECVAHHRLSNDTHRLSALAGAILIELARDGERSEAVLAEHHELPLADVREILEGLARLDLVARR